MTVFTVGLKHQRAGLMGWTNERVRRLCAVRRWTLKELGAQVGLFAKTPRGWRLQWPLLARCWRNNEWPPSLAWSFWVIEQQVTPYTEAPTVEPTLVEKESHG